MTCVRETPDSSALMQHSIFGIIPPRIVPSAISLRASGIVS
jgi:hypothetical protein